MSPQQRSETEHERLEREKLAARQLRGSARHHRPLPAAFPRLRGRMDGPVWDNIVRAYGDSR